MGTLGRQPKRVDDYDPWDIYDDLERERIRLTLPVLSLLKGVNKNASHQGGVESNGEHEKKIREEEGQKCVLLVDQQKETGEPEMARVDRIIDLITKGEPNGKNSDVVPTGEIGSTPVKKKRGRPKGKKVQRLQKNGKERGKNRSRRGIKDVDPNENGDNC